VTVGAPTEPRFLASDSTTAQIMDALQMRADAGPCQEAWETTQVVVCRSLADDDRWPRLTELAAKHDVASVLAVPVLVGDEKVGVLNGYATEPDAFGGLDIESAELLASAVGAVIHQVSERDRLTELAAQMEEALQSRAVIDQAKGIIVARYGCDPDQAFKRMVRASRNHNIKLREVARLLVEQAQDHGRGGGTLTPPEGP
jgi:transcriptional regulator with GAF, ATPase, and Fis domain